MFEVSYDETVKQKVYTFTLLTGFGLKIHPTKGHFDPILIDEHMGMIIDMKVGQFVAPTAKLKQIAVLIKTLLCQATTHKRWVSVNTLAFPGQKNKVCALGHPRGHVLLAGAAQCRQVREVIIGHRTRHPTAQARS